MELNCSKDNVSKFELNPPRLFEFLKEEDSEFTPNIINAVRIIEPVLSRIPEIFPNYTLHDIDHSIRVLEYIYDLIPKISDLSHLDITLFIYSALLHDIGMYATKEEIDSIKADKVEFTDYKFSEILKKNNNNEQAALQYYLRSVHAKRSNIFLREHILQYLNVPSQPATNFAEDISLVCESHNENVSWLKRNLKEKKEKGVYIYSPLLCALLLRLGDLLDFDSQRTPPILHKLINPQGISSEEWKKHFIIENKKKVKNDADLNMKKIVLYGSCTEPVIHRKLLKYIDLINSEIQNAVFMTEGIDEAYKLRIKHPTENRIEAKGYTISDQKLNIDYIAITNLLMGEKIYGSKTYGLREVLQNSIDACKVYAEMKLKNKKTWDEEYKPMISIVLNEADNNVIIKDNGIGMSYEIINKYFINIGKSYYTSDDFILRGFKYTPIGNFGIGFLSCFMLSNNVRVKTRYFMDHKCFILDLTKDDEYLCINEEENVTFNGTEIILDYQEFMSVFENKVANVNAFVKNEFLTDQVNISIIDGSDRLDIDNNLDVGTKGNVLDLGAYFNGIEGYIEYEFKNTIKKGFWDNVNTHGNPYFYKDYKLIKIDTDNFNPNTVCKNGKVYTYEIPIITDERKFNEAKEYIDDFDEIIDRIDLYIEWITVFIDVADWDIMTHDNFSVEDAEEILESKISFESLISMGNELDNTKVYVREHNLIINDGNYNLCLPYSLKKNTYYWRRKEEVYVRSIFVRDYSLGDIIKLDNLQINKIKANIFNKNILLNISRNDFDRQSKDLLDFAFNKSMHLWIYDTLLHDPEEKELLKRFLKENYNQSNSLLRVHELAK